MTRDPGARAVRAGSRPASARAASLASAALVLLACVGCGGSPGTVGPSGVDGLVVPTPSPDPADFVPVVDNPWLPLLPGSRWTREATSATGTRTVEVEVLDERRQVAGVEATQVRTATVGDSGRRRGERLSWYAQDRGGNVWALGEEGRWEAGVDGAEAGLAVTADPRLGDGHVRWAVDGEPGETVLVGERGASATVPAGRFTDLLETTWTLPDGGEWQVYLAPGVGEVVRQEVDGPGRIELVEHDVPD